MQQRALRFVYIDFKSDLGELLQRFLLIPTSKIYSNLMWKSAVKNCMQQ